MMTFNRRTYSIGEFGRESFDIAKDLRADVSALVGLPQAFRERIMLAVTGVNECRYCRFVHTRIGAFVGLSQNEIDAILEGDFSAAPDDERPALEFARRWAERDAETDPSDKAELVERYGRSRAEQIETCCRLIRLGNLTGNTLDSILFKISGGKIGD